MTESEQDITRAVIVSASEQKLVLAIPHTDYQLHLKPTAPINTPSGKRVRGVIQANALRMFATQGGGKFIEPVIGEPRIVAGRVLAVDQAKRRLLVDVVVPMWMTLDPRQPQMSFSVGELVNCYVESGITFTPA